jgi:hypothetical protein
MSTEVAARVTAALTGLTRVPATWPATCPSSEILESNVTHPQALDGALLWLAARANASLRAETFLAKAVPAPRSADSGLGASCDAWEALRPAAHVLPAAVLEMPPCPAGALAATRGGPSGAAGGIEVEGAAAPPPSASTAQLVCASTAPGRPPPLMALCFGGLARTQPHALVAATLRAHVIAPLGCSVRLFAHLRLEDRRGLTKASGKDFSATTRAATRSDVLKALRTLATPLKPAGPSGDATALDEAAAVDITTATLDVTMDEANDVVLLDSANAPVPPCQGKGGVYDWARGGSGAACAAYSTPCSQHIVDGMLYTRLELAKLIFMHEARHRVAFDAALFLRPDVVAVLPFHPWCFYFSHTGHPARRTSPPVARRNQDWLELLPRALVDAAWYGLPHAYYNCTQPTLTSLGPVYAEVAAKHGVHYVQDEALRAHVQVLRDNQPNLPHRKSFRASNRCVVGP